METFAVIGAIGLFLFFSALVTGNRPAAHRYAATQGSLPRASARRPHLFPEFHAYSGRYWPVTGSRTSLRREPGSSTTSSG